MSSLTIEFKGATEEVLEQLIKKGYAKTKSEALRFALIKTGNDLKILKEEDKSEFDEFLFKIQQEKMKELWGNKEDEEWENA